MLKAEAPGWCAQQEEQPTSSAPGLPAVGSHSLQSGCMLKWPWLMAGWPWAGTGEKTKKMSNTATCPVQEKKLNPNPTKQNPQTPRTLCSLWQTCFWQQHVCSRSGRMLPTGSMEWDFLQLGCHSHLCWLGSSHCELEKWRNYQSGFSGEVFSKQSNPGLWSFQAWTAAFAPGWTWGVLPAGISLALRAFELRQQ